MKKTVLVAAVSALALSTAFAQSPPSSSGSSMNPPAASSAPSSSGSSSASSTSGSSGQNIVSTQSSNQWLASKLKGTDVIGPDNVKIGDVSDVVIDRSGTVAALVVGVGGFLGIGSKDVALSMASFQPVAGKDGQPDQLKVSMTKDQLKEAPEFKPLQSAANDTAPGAMPRPAGSPSSMPSSSPPAGAR